MNVRTVLESTVKRLPGKLAFVFHEKKITFSDLAADTLRLANIFQDLGIKKGDKVVLYHPNSLDLVYGYLACFYLGAVAVPLDYMLKEDELTSCIGHSEAKLVFARSKPDVSLTKICQSLLKKVQLLSCDEGSFDALFKSTKTTLAPIEINDSDPALIMYTSGTTGAPKGILLNYRHLDGSPEAMKHFVDLTENDIKLAAIPLTHIGGFIYLQNCICFGITVVLMDRFNPFEFLQNIQKYKITCFHIVPPMYTAMLTVKGIDQFDLSSLRWVVVFGAPSSPEILERFHKYCPNAQLLNGWGMTETCPPNTVTPLCRPGPTVISVGKPSPISKIKIIDDKDKEVPIGEIGEIVISGWIIMEEYYKDPKATAEVKRNGWLHTGDLGRFDQEGFLYIVGRKKEMIKVAGQIVYAPEVEAALYKHEAVSEAAVIGVPDKMRGETVKAFVVLKDGSNISAEDIKFFAKDHLAKFKVPDVVELRSSLPKNRTGKIDKVLLQQECVV